MRAAACGQLRIRRWGPSCSLGLTSQPHVRPYHTPWRPSSSPTYSDSGPEARILSAALPHVPELGFSDQALARGAREAGFLAASVSLLPRGPFELVLFHLVQQRLALAESAVSTISPDSDFIPVAERLRQLTWARLQANGPVASRYTEALALMSLAGNVPVSLAELARLSDDLWYLAGDTAVDGRWYAKRTALAGVYAASEVFMSRDRSEGFLETKSFLERRLEDMQAAGDGAASVGQWLGFTAASSVNVLRSWGVRI